MKRFKYKCRTLLEFFKGEIEIESLDKAKIELQKKHHSIVKCVEINNEDNFYCYEKHDEKLPQCPKQCVVCRSKQKHENNL